MTYYSRHGWDTPGAMAIAAVENLFTLDEIREINKQADKFVFSAEKTDAGAEGLTKSSRVGIINWLPMTELLHPFISFIQEANRQFFGFDIYFHFNNETLNYNVYEKDQEYDWHLDAAEPHIRSDMKLTCILNTSEEPYEGGELLIKGTVNETLEGWNQPGAAVIFHPTRLHKVNPITKGKRITISYWAMGPAWR